jgi:hypothetical protein
MRTRPVVLALSLCAFAAAQACGGDDTAILPDASMDASIDTSTDDTGLPDTGPAPDSGDDAATDGGATDGGATDGSKTDGGGGGILLRCGDASVSDCAQCNGATQPCVYCATNDASALQGLCTQLHQGCQNSIPNGFEDCRCGNGDASACPEKYQVCTGAARCHTCSDNNANNGLTCENGGKCTYADGGCN